MRGIEPRSDVASTGLLRAQFVKALFLGSDVCTNTYIDKPIRIKVPSAPTTRANSSGLLSRCRVLSQRHAQADRLQLALRQRVRSQCA